MSFLDRLRAAGSAFFSTGGTSLFRTFWPTNSSIRVDEYVAQTMSYVWACLTILSNSVAQLPIGLYRDEPDGDVVRVTDHPVAKILLLGFNADLSTFYGLYSGQTQIGLSGNSFFQIERGDGGVPERLHLLSSSTYPELDLESPWDIITNYVVPGRNGINRDVAPENVLHVRGHTCDGLMGMSPITAAREAIGLGLVQEKFGAKFFANDARSGGFIIQEARTNTGGRKAQQEDVAEKQGGADNAWKPKVLDPGVKFISTTMSQQDSQYLTSRAFQGSEIARFYNVPEFFVNSTAATAWGSGIEQIFIGFVVNTVVPIVTRWEDEMSRKLLTPEERLEGLHIRMDVTALLRGDSTARGELLSKLLSAGMITRNEGRRREGFNKLPGLDEPLQPANMQSQKQIEAAAKTSAAQKGPPANGQDATSRG